MIVNIYPTINLCFQQKKEQTVWKLVKKGQKKVQLEHEWLNKE